MLDLFASRVVPVGAQPPQCGAACGDFDDTVEPEADERNAPCDEASHERHDGAELLRLGRGLTSEMIAACAKLMTNLDLIVAARKIRVVVHATNTVGLEGRLSVRLQPNHPSDSIEGILASVKEGVSYGCGDAVLGVNPVTDDVDSCKKILDATHDFITAWRIPTLRRLERIESHDAGY